jgi:nickel-dependent lactate racemase
MNTVDLSINEFYGDNTIHLDFPEKWKVELVKMTGHDHPALTDPQIKDALNHPIGTQTIAKMAKGKRKVVITCDDLQRPTPAHRVLPFILKELEKAGITDDQIFILGAFGTHHPMSQEAFGKKVGWDMVRRFDCVNHNPFENFVDLGQTSRGTPLFINKEFMKADLKIIICGIKQHDYGGSGGSGKSVLPGVASIKTIGWNHRVISALSKYHIWKIKGNDARADMQEAARIAGVDFLINCTCNNKRELIGLHAGDLDDSWHEAIRFCYKMHSTIPPKKKADIVVVNSYPLACHGVYGWGAVSNSLKESGSLVSIHETPLGSEILHYHEERRRVGQRLAGYPEEKAKDLCGHPEGPFTPAFQGRPWPNCTAKRIIVCDQRYSKRDVLRLSPKVEWKTSWSKALETLKEDYKNETTVSVYPCAPFQFNPNKYPLNI